MLTKNEAVNKAKELIQESGLIEVLEKENIFTVYVSGSIFEGFGNSKSDIDIFILSMDKIDNLVIEEFLKKENDFNFLDSGAKKVLVTTRKGIDFDIEIYEKDYVMDFPEMVSDFNSSPRGQRYDLFHRLKFAEPLINSENLVLLKKCMDYKRFNLLAGIVNRDYYTVRVIDILGAYEEEDFGTSLKMALDLLEDSMSAYLSFKNETNPNPKWLMKKIRRYSETKSEEDVDLYEMLSQAYQEIELGSKEAMKKKTLDLLRNCQLLNFKCEEEIKSYENQ